MAIPDFQTIMLPLIKFAGDQQEHSIQETIENLAETFKLSEEERKYLLPSGKDRIFNNRVRWAILYLKKANLIETTKRAHFKITQRGEDVLNQNPKKINVKFLEQYSEFIEFRDKSKLEKETSTGVIEEISQQTPEESLEYGYQKMRRDLAVELLNQVKNCSSDFFERLVVELLVRIGYGGSLKNAGKAIGRTGDGGIDGIINEDLLGLDVIYIQAKNWEQVVGRPEIQKFVGALVGKRAKKGVFITTSSFSKNAIEYVTRIESKVVLIDGEQLAQLMIDHDIGVSKDRVYQIKKLDSDYFAEE
jgi:restriction system protein